MSDDSQDMFAEDVETVTATEMPWSAVESNQLMQAIKSNIPRDDKLSYSNRITKLNWENISIDGRTSDNCKKQLSYLIKNVRRVRVLGEVLDDAIFNFEFMKEKPLNAYQLFTKHVRNQHPKLNGKSFFVEASKLYKKLRPEESAKFEAEAARLKADYKKLNTRKKVSRAQTPFQWYCEQRTELGDTDRVQMRTLYQNLNNDEKLKWIHKAMDAAKLSGVIPTTVLSKFEKVILTGKPKRPLSAYNYFIRDYCNTNKSKKTNLKELSLVYGGLSDEQKAVYVKKAKEHKIKYNREIAAFKLKEIDTEIENSFIGDETNLSDTIETESFAYGNEVAISNDDSATRSIPPNAKANTKPKSRHLSENSSSIEGSSSEDSGSEDSSYKSSIKKIKIEEPEKPQSSTLQYFAEKKYKCNKKKAMTAYAKLSASDKNEIKKEHKTAIKIYMKKLEYYLQSLSKQEMIEYAERSRIKNDNDAEEESSESSESVDSNNS